MSYVIDDAMIEHVSILAKLELTEKEREAAKKDMERMLDYIDRLNGLDTSGVEPMSHTLLNAPDRKEDMFVVPKTI